MTKKRKYNAKAKEELRVILTDIKIALESLRGALPQMVKERDAARKKQKPRSIYSDAW